MVRALAGFLAGALAALPPSAAAAQTPPGDPPFIVRAELSERLVWESSQALYTVRVYQPAGARRPGRIRSLEDPVLLSGEALIERLGTDREYSVRSEDAESLVLERRYALFPQSPGELLLAPVSLRWTGGEYGFRTRTFLQDAEPRRLRARPVPGPPAGVWLAAADVRLWDEFERAPEDLVAGEPLVRLLGVRVEGQPARQIPELDPGQGPNFRHFIERPEFEDIVTRRGLVGVRRQRAALLALRGGDLALPAIRLDWWNTASGRWETAELPPRLLQAEAPLDPAAQAAAAPRPSSGPNGWLVPLLAAGWFVTAVAWWASRRIGADRRRRAAVLARFADRAGRSGGQPARHWAVLCGACRKSDAPAAERALLAWSRTRPGCAAARNLGELGKCLGGPAGAEIARLSAALYAPRGGSWNPPVLLAALRGLPRPSVRPQSGRSALPPLWPGESAEKG